MSRRIAGVLAACALSGGLLAAQDGKAQRGFPDYAETEYEHSIITIPIVLNGETQPAEVLKLDAFMKLDREKPVRNGLGYRQFEFTIDAWELYGYSKALDAYITFKLSDTVKPKSLGVSLQKNKDYPAMIVYNAIYDIYVNDVKVGQNRAGVAFATGVMEIPPRNITVAFNKPFGFSLKGIQGPGSLQKQDMAYCPYDLCFDPGTCEDMEQISADQFTAGANKAKSYRTKRQAQLKKDGGASTAATKKKAE
ncbi:MAG TPA: hypothetical protein VMW27_24995 [Thermoanaerobaculia bacterium]|nr:hypothetical protein [Thermoanaerobaculia bacterium]